ncbi:MAG: hypothetical protein B7Z37_26185 [Verrucomicrobia bacterium 12-59-8]|nr:MAG: hypothetical protein B7Z37_26185 [Verrucomicrobia bacterium 12-59-8]
MTEKVEVKNWAENTSSDIWADLTTLPGKKLGQSIVVTARGTVDLNKRTMEGHGRANVRGIVGVIISPISVVFMEMQVKGPFDDIKVAPLGLIGAAKSVLKMPPSSAASSSAKASPSPSKPSECFAGRTPRMVRRRRSEGGGMICIKIDADRLAPSGFPCVNIYA